MSIWRRYGRAPHIPGVSRKFRNQVSEFMDQNDELLGRLSRHTYGAGGTIHQTGTIDIQVDADTGRIVAVWFRCLNLPFRVSKERPGTSISNPADFGMVIESVTYVEPR